MTPTHEGKTTRITVEKVRKDKIDESKVALKAGGQHAGLVINNYDEGNSYIIYLSRLELNCVPYELLTILLQRNWCFVGDVSKPVPNPDIQMEFTCYLVNQKTGRSVPVSDK